MIDETEYKGCKAVILENESLKVAILPSLGARIASIYRKDKEFELLFQDNQERNRKSKEFPLDKQFEATGFDDCFPTIHACDVTVEGRQIHYPDHGETWRIAFDYKFEDEKVVLECKSGILPYHLCKTVSLEEDFVIIHYTITNTGDFDFPCIWAMHCLINCDEGMQMIFPEGTKEILNVYENQFLGRVGTIHPFPITHTPDGLEFRLDRVLPVASKNCNKYYVKGKVAEGCCGAYYPAKDVTYIIHFDKVKLPFLGFWVTEGAFRGDYNCALEPTNGYYDDINTAQRENSLYVLEKGDTLQFDIMIELK